MINQELLDYINQQLQQGVSQDQIKEALVSNGWQSQDVEEAFNSIQNTTQPPQKESSDQSPKSLPGPTDSLKEAWGIYKIGIKNFLIISAIPAFFSMGLALYLKQEPSVWVVLFLVLIVFVVQTLSQLALIYAIKDRQEGVGIKELYQRAWNKIFSYCWIVLLVTFITLGGYFLLFVPGLIFSVWFSLAVFILVQENLKGMNALLKSREYVRGMWTSVLYRFFFIGILFSIPALILNGFFSLLNVPFGSEISTLIISLFAPVFYIYLFSIYKRLKAIKGEFDFNPTKGKKLGFIFVGIWGLVAPLVLIFVLITTIGLAFLKASKSIPPEDFKKFETEFKTNQ